MEVGWSLRWRVEGGRERSDWRGIFFIFYFLDFYLIFVLIFGGKFWGVGIDRVVYLYCMDENGDYGGVVVVVVVGNRCPRISG